MKVTEAISFANEYLRRSNGLIKINEMYSLLCYATGKEKEVLILDSGEVSSEDLAEFFQLLLKRAKGMPISQIIGKRSFWRSEFLINVNVLDPRPDSECIIEVALDLSVNPSKILECLKSASNFINLVVL